MTELMDAYQSLLKFLYRSPVAALQATLDGHIDMLTPLAAQFLMPHTHGGKLDNLFDVLDEFVPQVRRQVDAFAPANGTVCQSVLLQLPARGNAAAQVLSLGLVKLDGRWLMAWMSDVTLAERRLEVERHAGEQERLELAEHLSLATEAAGVGTFDVDVAGGALRWNAQTFTLYGCEPSAGLDPGSVFDSALAPDERRNYERWLHDVQGGRANGTLEFEITRVDGEQRWLAAKGRMRQAHAERPASLVGVTWDVTEQRRSAAALQAQRVAEQANFAKNAFLSRMSHELRTPLNAMMGFTEVLIHDSESPLTSRQRLHVTLIRDAGQHLLHLTSDLMDLSCIEMGVIPMHLEPVDAALVAVAVLREAEPQAIAQQVRLDWSVPTQACVVHADRTRLRQVLQNLVSNALKYNHAGGTVSISAERCGESWRLHVSDSGLGMSAQQLQSLFEPFNRLGRETSAVPGTGIGLVLTRHLVAAMGGSLSVNSREGAGSDFIVEVPAARFMPAPAASQVGDTTLHRADVQGRVLAVEDDPVNALLLRTFLAWRPGVVLEVVSTGAECVAAARRTPPDLLLLDMMLPDMTGVDVLRALRREPAWHAPCIAISADALPHQIGAALSAGVDRYVTKPIDPKELLQAIDQLLARAGG